MVFIAYNHENKVINIVNSKSKELANAYWQGKGLFVHTVRCLEDREDFMSLNEHPTGVYPIMETIEIKVCNIDRNAKIICVK